MAKFTLSFNREYCKGCELCVSACPKNLLELDKEASNDAGYYPAGITDQEACIGCQSCARMCPDCVITITRND